MIPINSGGEGGEGSEEGTSTRSKGDGGGGGVGVKTTTLKKGPWTAGEDAILIEYVKKNGEGNWNALQRNSGLARCGKSCRLRWANHLRPNLKKGSFSPEEERLILELHANLGNKWARMAAQLPGRTDNEIKNYWNTRLKRRQRQGLPLYPQDMQTPQPYTFHLQQNTTQSQIPLSPSPTPPPQSHLSSPHQPKPPTYNNSSLSLFDPISLSSPPTTFFTAHTPPPHITSQFNGYKRYRHSGIGFSLPQQPSSSLGRHSMSTQLPHISSFQLGSSIFDQNSPQMLQTQCETEYELVQPLGGLAYSAKHELPSSQLSQTTAQWDEGGDTKIELNVVGGNGGLLDDLLREAEAMSRKGGDSTRGGLLGSDKEKGVLDGFGGDWDDSSSVHSSAGKRSVEQNMNYIHEDFPNILGLIPSTMQAPLWYSDGGEISNGQSSGLTEDNIGLEMQQLPVNTTIWDNMPGIC